MTTRFAATRRDLIAGGLAALVTPLLARAAEAAKAACGVARTLTPKPEKAVSLKRLCQGLVAFDPKDKRYKKLLQFNGMTRLDGYITDPASKDIVLWGVVERGAPPLEFQDLVVAMRAWHGSYVEKRDGKTVMMAPAISIDPDPNVFRKLHTVKLNGPGWEETYKEVCSAPQKVRVEGMPRGCRPAHILVDADYRMKQVSQGSYRLPIKAPFPSDTAERWAEQRRNMIAGVEGEKPKPLRYWFQPGMFTYQVSAERDTIFLDRAQVVLNDEQQNLGSSGGLKASGGIDKFARAFSCAWTERMEDTYRAEPIWRDMHNIFRHFALARIVADRRDLYRVRFDERILMESFDLPLFPTPSVLKGLSRMAEFEHKYKKGGRSGTVRSAAAVCGGVALGFDRDTLQEEADAGATGATGKLVLASRPDADAISWDVTGDLKLTPVAPKTPGTPTSPLKEILKRHTKTT